MLHTRRWIKAITGALVLCLLGSVMSVHGQAQGVREGVVRLHVLANSDSTADQTVKLQVRDAVTAAAAGWLDGAADAEDALAMAEEQLPRIREAAQETVAAAGADYPVKVETVRMYFTTRQYDTYTLPAGMYDAVRVTLGEGKGQNWWCVVYPPLCTGAATDLSQTLAPEGQELVENGGRYEVRFKLVEWLESFFQLFR